MNDLINYGYSFKTKPFAHQLEWFDKLKDVLPGFGIFWEMGLGKGKFEIDLACWHYMKKRHNCFLVITDKGMIRTWTKDFFPNHMPDEFAAQANIVEWDPYGGKKQKKKLLTLLEPQKERRFDVLVINHDALSSVNGFKFLESLVKARDVMCVLDEASKFKNLTAKKTKNLLKLKKHMKLRYPATGTPVSESALNVFPIMEFLDAGLLGHTSQFAFKHEFCQLQRMTIKRMVNSRLIETSFDAIVGFKNLDRLYNRMKPYASRLLKSECLDLPGKVYSTKYVKLTQQQAKIYNDLVGTSVAALDEANSITTPIILTQLLRLRQVCNNFVRPDGETKGFEISPEDPKYDALVEILEDALEGNKKFIIWSSFSEVIERLEAKLTRDILKPDQLASFYGATTQDKRQEFVERFQRSADSLRGGLINPAAGGYGLTLTEAEVEIFYDNDWSREKRLQAEGRTDRIGQKRVVSCWDIVAEGTVEEDILRAHRDKENVSDIITGDIFKKVIV